MNSKQSRWTIIVGLVLMVIGIVDPLEGSVVILAGSLLTAIGAFLSHTGYRLPIAAFALIAVGVGAMFGMSAMGGIGGNSGRSIWWILLCLPYPVGWILGLIGAASKLRERRSAAA
jgi:hypothetical protein